MSEKLPGIHIDKEKNVAERIFIFWMGKKSYQKAVKVDSKKKYFEINYTDITAKWFQLVLPVL
jgi:hypothetical protein